MPVPRAAPPSAPFCAVLMLSHPPARLAAASTSAIAIFRICSPFAKSLPRLERVVLERASADITDGAADQAGAHDRPERTARRQADACAEGRASNRTLLCGAHIIASTQQARRGEHQHHYFPQPFALRQKRH